MGGCDKQYVIPRHAGKTINFETLVDDPRVTQLNSFCISFLSRFLAPSPPVERFQEFQDYRERLLKAENQLVNALGFDFMIEHPYSHSTDLMEYMIKEGEARDCRKRQLCVLCSGPGGVGGPVIIAPSERWGSSCVPIVLRSYLSTVFYKKKRIRHTRNRRIFALGSTGLFKYSTRYLYHLRHAYFGPGSDYCFGPGSKYYVRQGVTYSTVKFLRDGFSMCFSDVGPDIRTCLSRTWCFLYTSEAFRCVQGDLIFLCTRKIITTIDGVSFEDSGGECLNSLGAHVSTENPMSATFS